MQKLKILVLLAVVATLAVIAYSSGQFDYNLRKLNHETYQKGDDNYDFCMNLCDTKGGINCGGKRKGCCQQGHCNRNKIYGWDECESGFSQKLGTDRCIGTWNTGNN